MFKKAIYPGTEAMDALQTDLKAVDTTFKDRLCNATVSPGPILDKAIKSKSG